MESTYMIQFEDTGEWCFWSTYEFESAADARRNAPTEMYGEPVKTRIIRVERVVIDD